MLLVWFDEGMKRFFFTPWIEFNRWDIIWIYAGIYISNSYSLSFGFLVVMISAVISGMVKNS